MNISSEPITEAGEKETGEKNKSVMNAVKDLAYEIKMSEPDERAKTVSRKSSEKPTNEYVLNFAFFSFLGFVLVQMVAALIARSQAMLADCEAMLVDAMTYLFNLCAERLKHRPLSDDEKRLPAVVRIRRRKKMRLYLELIPPLISVSTLIVLTGFVLNEAIRTLLGVENGDEDEEEEPNVTLMFFFSALNLLLDVVNVTCFARAEVVALGLPVMHGHSKEMDHAGKVKTANSSLLGASSTSYSSVPQNGHVEMGETVDGTSQEPQDKESTDEESRNVSEQKVGSPLLSSVRMGYPTGLYYLDETETEECENDCERDGPDNLNMCSAYTHVFADTLRSIAVVIAAAIAYLVDGVSGDVADATAAVVVSVIIIMSLTPLFQGLLITWRELQELNAESRTCEVEKQLLLV